MRTLWFFFALALASTAFAQDQAKPYGKFYGPLATGDWKMNFPPSASLRPFATTAPQTMTSTCSVPLLEVPISKDVHFTGQIAQVDLSKVEQMPQAKVFAPPCDPAR